MFRKKHQQFAPRRLYGNNVVSKDWKLNEVKEFVIPRKQYGDREGFKVEIQEILFYGITQGYKVWLSDSTKSREKVLRGKTIKFPLTVGEWYTMMDSEEAVKQAFRDLHDIVIHNYRRK